ncbi:hypothetical protein [Streptosporangium sp. H16]|uniref:hypothetical protein n=1 Tax=Streptosporangium sp. H16 TaxID=3444184 RepID=UPI003F792868
MILHLGYGIAGFFDDPEGGHQIRTYKGSVIDVSKQTFWKSFGCIYLTVRNRSNSEVTISDWRLIESEGGVMFAQDDNLPFRIDPKDFAVIALPEFCNNARKSSRVWQPQVTLGESGATVKARQRVLVPPDTKWGGRGDVGLVFNPSEIRRAADIRQMAEEISARLRGSTNFYSTETTSREETCRRLETFKFFIEKQDGYKLLHRNGVENLRENDVQILFQAVWHGTPFDVNREPRNGRGAVDFSVSMGSKDKSLVEFKLASSKRLESGLRNQLKIYEDVNRTSSSFYVIVYSDAKDEQRIGRLMNSLTDEERSTIVLVDAREDNKGPASGEHG